LKTIHVSTTVNGDAAEFVCDPTKRCGPLRNASA